MYAACVAYLSSWQWFGARRLSRLRALRLACRSVASALARRCPRPRYSEAGCWRCLRPPPAPRPLKPHASSGQTPPVARVRIHPRPLAVAAGGLRFCLRQSLRQHACVGRSSCRSHLHALLAAFVESAVAWVSATFRVVVLLPDLAPLRTACRLERPQSQPLLSAL